MIWAFWTFQEVLKLRPRLHYTIFIRSLAIFIPDWGCCLHNASAIRYAAERKSLRLEVILKAIRYVPYHKNSSANRQSGTLQWKINIAGIFSVYTCHHATRSSTLFNLSYKQLLFLANIYLLFTGREVRIEKKCARGLEYGQFRPRKVSPVSSPLLEVI